MKNLIILLTLIGLSSCKKKEVEKEIEIKIPTSEMGHIDLVLDSLAFYDVLQDTFLTEIFSVSSQDTKMYSKPSYDLYLLGQETFFHLSLAKEFWENMEGSGVIVFQSLNPGVGDSLLQAWQTHYADSLYFHTYEGSDFQFQEVMPNRKKNSESSKQANFTPILTSYTKESYLNWGFSEDELKQGVSMRQFMKSWDTTTMSKPFKKIKALAVQVLPQELVELESALMTLGYSKGTESFTHSIHPEIHYSIFEATPFTRYTKIEIELDDPNLSYETQLGNSYLVKVEDGLLVLEAIQK